MVYTAETDPLCYPGTTVLRNKMGLTDQFELDEFELAVTLTRFDEFLPAGKLNYPHYLALHHHLFQDVYEWAGQLRTIRIGKGGNWFCYPEYIDGEMKRIFADLQKAKRLVGLSPKVFAQKAAHVLAEINAVHPFREGNGRTQLAFLSLLAENAGFAFNEDLVEAEKERVMVAMIESFSGGEEPLAAIVLDVISIPSA